MNEIIWNEKLDFLKAIRTGWCNADYIEFLVEKVWKINKPVNILDFGCGFGYVGLLLLPMLAKGSTYTGIDFSEILLTEAENIFDESGYSTRFIKADLSEYMPVETYDIVISQAVLRHIPGAKDILEKMIQSVVQGGLVICMEGDLEIEKAGQYFEGLDYTELDIPSLHRKMFRKELLDGGRDYRFGIKIPVLMQQLGLSDVGVRMNDCVKFINPFGDKDVHEKQYNAIVKAWGWDKKISNQEKLNLINTFIQRGLSEEEAGKFVDGQIKISNYAREHKHSAFIIQAPCIMISYGRK
ncbi:class I SAM-dependent methyltransferase [Clostridium folliculivorans]|uniref:Class I SAM-dependent methyltransferase n=1 Tax=Clostridium folliculivorans TaxID=2886038 RepID=A0A9W6DDN6_9CLOT|nr:class I SAM-dependent methyltransferase [Clostridium folliculivorans]GKU27872.1 class I SAM-dependent methyltransferase [Clostridium folliculivorans]GKU32631.1 class I SAM-dependent methyltransferase [Clostridium folliculivorans]